MNVLRHVNEEIQCVKFTFRSPGFLRELRPLLHGAEPAASAYRGPLRPPAAAGLAHSHRHEDGAVDVHEQVHLKRSPPAFSLTCQPATAKRGTFICTNI